MKSGVPTGAGTHLFKFFDRQSFVSLSLVSKAYHHTVAQIVSTQVENFFRCKEIIGLSTSQDFTSSGIQKYLIALNEKIHTNLKSLKQFKTINQPKQEDYRIVNNIDIELGKPVQYLLATPTLVEKLNVKILNELRDNLKELLYVFVTYHVKKSTALGLDPVEIVKKLIRHGAQLDFIFQPMFSGKTVLISAAAQGLDEIVKMLLESNANVNVKTLNGVTALMEAAQNGHTKVVLHLLRHKASLEIQSAEGKTALSLALAHKRDDVINILNNINLNDEYKSSVNLSI